MAGGPEREDTLSQPTYTGDSPTLPSASERFPLSQHIGPFQITGVLGSGGMGIVYRATGPEGEAAVKVLMGALSADARQRFAREAAIRIEHPNIVRTLAADVDDPLTPYIAFELLKGETLEDVIRTRRLSDEECISIGIQACRALSFAHHHGIVHRDLKPANLFLTESGNVKLLDFGIAALTDRETRITRSGMVMGTPSYFSPEQARGELDIDPRADVWGLAAVLYHALSGRPPFAAGSVLATIVAVIIQPVEPLSYRAPHVSASLASIIERALAKAPDDRWATMDAMLDALLSLERHGTGSRSTTAGARPAIDSEDQHVLAVLLAQGVSDHHRLTTEIETRGGAVLPIVGRRAVGLFGLRAWTEDEATNAVEAGLAALEVAQCVAVTTGRAARVGTTFTGTALASAEACCAAYDSGLVINRDTARAITGYHLEEQAPGMYLVRGKTELRAERTPSRSELHGRDAELAMVRRAVRSVTEDQCAMTVLISGAAGMGKGRLCHAVMSELELMGGVITLSARARPHLERTALALFRALLESRLDELDLTRTDALKRQHAIYRMCLEAIADKKRAAECADFIGELLGVPMPESPTLGAARTDPQLMSDQLRRALKDFCSGLLATHTLGIFAEEIQWADDDSLRMLAEIADAAAAKPLLILTTARSEFDPKKNDLFRGRDAMTIDLLGLASFDVARLAESIAGCPLPPLLVKALYERTGGNPLFVEQIVTALTEEKRLDDSVDRLPLPLTVEAAVQSRINQLPHVEREILKRASILRRPFRYSELAALGVPDAQPHLDSLVVKGVLASRRRERTDVEAEHRFKSSLMADVVGLMIGDLQRAELHRLAASYLATTDADPEDVAAHYEAGGVPERAAALYTTAAFRASAQGDSRRVARCAERAWQLGPPAEQQFDLNLAHAEAYQFLGRHHEQLGILMEANTVACTETQRARSLTELIKWYMKNRDLPRALEIADSAVAAAERTGSDEMLALALGAQAGALTYAGRLTEAEEVLHETEQVAGRCSTRIRALTAGWRGQLVGAQGDLGLRLEAFGAARDLYAETGDVRRATGAAVNLADAYNRLGCYAEAEASLFEALAGCRSVGNRPMEGYALVNLGYATGMLGRYDDAMQTLEKARAIADAIADQKLRIAAMVYQARTAVLAQAAPPELAESLAGVGDEAQQRALWGFVVSALSLAARIHLDHDNHARALNLTTRAMAVLDRVGSVEEDEAEAYLAHAAALIRNDRGRDARVVLMKGRVRVLTIALGILDLELRRFFLERVPAHRELLARTSDEDV